MRRFSLLVPVLAAGCYATPVGGTGGGSGIKTVQLGPGGQQRKGADPAPAMPGVNVPAVKVNTVGYPTKWTKVAVFNIAPKNVAVKDAASGEVVFDVPDDKIVHKGVDAASQDEVWQVDFTEFAKPGTYEITGDGAESDAFTIGDDVYAEALFAGQKHFYFQRTRMPLEKPYAEWKGHAYTRKSASHVHEDVGWDLTEYPKKKTKWKVEGGWHDAGNFDMYIPSTGPTAQALLMAYEWDPSQFKDGDLNIPESGNGIPDLLDETKWGLIWILSIQEENGAFRHREAVTEWSPEGPADEDKTERWIAGISTAASAKAVAVLARAARVYAKHDPAFAKRCDAAAKKGWAWLVANPKRVIVDGLNKNQPLWDDEPEFTDVGARFVAAAEMWRTYHDPKALEWARALLKEKEAQPEEILKGAWSNLSRWALGELAMDPKTPKDLRKEAKSRVLAAAELLRKQVNDVDGYRCASSTADYYWAHNSNLMEKAHVLLMASKLAPDEQWLVEAARDQWHWVLGRNPNGYSMVTQIGKAPTRMYHMEWGQMEPPPPGYLIGGPNGQNLGFLAPGAPAKALLWDNPEPLRSGVPAHGMWHWHQSDLWDAGWVPEGEWTDGWWAVTEPDIYYNGNLVLVAVAMQ